MNKRELKFRIWDAQYKRFVKGYENKNHYDELYSDPPGLIFGGLAYLNEYGEYYTVQQFTGLKDKNDKEIYEGDIVRCHRLRFPDNHRKDIDFSKLPWPEDHWYDCIEIGKIRWSDVSFGFVEDYEHIRYDDIWPLSCGTSHRYEVIGNIFENKDLLK
jgi:hypothetical protein